MTAITRERPFRKCLWLTLSLLLICTGTQGAPPASRPGEQKPAQEIRVEEGQQQTAHFPGPLTRVAVGDPAVADVALTTPQDLLITGKAPGTTSLHIWSDERSRPQHYRLLVDPALIDGEFGLQAEHDSRVPADDGQPNPRDTTRVEVGGSQIQADIKVVEISRTGLKEAGFFFGKNSPNTTLAIAPPGTLSGVQSAESGAGNLLLESASGFLPFAQAFQLVFGNSNQSWLSTISLLEQGGYAYTLAEPSLVVMNGQTANFLAGGEFPIPVAQGGSTSGAVSIQYREFGIRLMLTPTLLEADRIALKVAPEVSELDFSAGVQTAGTRVPALKVRRTDTTIELGDGESFAISGLISQTTIANEDKLPWLGDLPYIGAFFRSKRFQKDDKELLMVVTPHIVHPLNRDADLPPLPGEAYRSTDPDYADFLFRNQQPASRRQGGMEGFSR